MRNETVDKEKQGTATIDDIFERFDQLEEIEKEHILGVAQGINIGYSMASAISKKKGAF